MINPLDITFGTISYFCSVTFGCRMLYQITLSLQHSKRARVYAVYFNCSVDTHPVIINQRSYRYYPTNVRYVMFVYFVTRLSV